MCMCALPSVVCGVRSLHWEVVCASNPDKRIYRIFMGRTAHSRTSVCGMHSLHWCSARTVLLRLVTVAAAESPLLMRKPLSAFGCN